MQPRSVTIEEGKDPAVTARTSQTRVFPQRLLQLLLAFFFMCVIFSVVLVYMIRYFGVHSTVTEMATVKPTFQSCDQEPTSLEHWIKPPSNLLHKMTDKELFWRATFLPRIQAYPFERVPKIAFMFLTKGPLPLAPIWERFFKGHEGYYSIYVHSLPSFEADYPPSSVFYRRQIPSQITQISSAVKVGICLLDGTLAMEAFNNVSEWGRMSMCDAERRLLANALLDISNEWFVLLSESCIPLYNFSAIYHYIKRSRYSFMGAFDDPGPYGRGRYNENMAPVVNISQWRKGSQWFEINRELAVNIVEDTKFYPKFATFCRPACYVDEHYFPTMLTIQAANQLANRSITWVDWSRGGAHPATFGRSDITEEFLKRVLEGHSCLYNNQPSSVCFLFARKFAPSALEPLLLVAPKYFGY